jgi:hypothetical protein
MRLRVIAKSRRSKSRMEGIRPTLVVILSMHRCGSSLTANVLQRLGMSLGPFELNGAAPSNPHGHFESVPFMLLNRQVQQLAHGFPDDLPDSPDVLARFVKTRGQWDDSIVIPDKMIAEGRSLVRALVYSGRVSGFKDPRTVLAWPFWERVLEGFPGLRIVTVGLIRSPHEIAMSLVSRRAGTIGYWSALDTIAIHLLRMKQILLATTERPGVVCFGESGYRAALADVVQQCGLTWNDEVANEVYDETCVHHVPAAIVHEAQEIFDSMIARPLAADFRENQLQLQVDSRVVEEMHLREWKANRERIAVLEAAVARTEEIERHLHTAMERLAYSQRLFEQTAEALNSMQAKLIASQEREIQAWEYNERLRDRLDRFESHPIIGLALRGRRRLRSVVDSVKSGLHNGQESHEFDTLGLGEHPREPHGKANLPASHLTRSATADLRPSGAHSSWRREGV